MNVQLAYKRFLTERESQEEAEDENIPEDIPENVVEQADLHRILLRDEANEALEVENNIRREQERLLRVERERNHSEQPQPKKQKTTRGNVVKRKRNSDDDVLPRKVSRKVSLAV
jgi:hypothetical protein